MNNNHCTVCQSNLNPGRESWHFVCPTCSYEKGQLQPAINAPNAHQLIDEDNREAGLRALRQSNFQQMVDVIKSLKPAGGKLLDVGAAHGWFLDVASQNFHVLGIEPDQQVYEASLRRGAPLRLGYFPDALTDDEKFDVIVFNDVIEHIPDIKGILKACHDHLNADGLLVLNLPSSQGVFYRASKLLHVLGATAFFERLWQKGLPSPHVHYFNLSNLNRLLNESSFLVQASGRLPSLRLQGLFTRISYTGKHNVVTRLVIYAVVALSLPLLRILPSDIVYTVSKRQ